MKIGEVIRKYRKEKGLTQEEMANRLGVTTPAVNKWENHVTLPDVMLLAPIARLLGISVDTLLCYREELSTEEIRSIVNALWEKVNRGAFHEAILWMKEKLAEFPSCYELLLYLPQAVETAFVVMPQYKSTELETYIEQCYIRALESEREEIRTRAAEALYNACVRREDYAQAETYLMYFSVENPERKRKQALLYAKCGQTEEACRLYEELLYTTGQTMRMVLLSLYTIVIEQRDFVQAKLLTEKHSGLMRVLDMGVYNEAAAELEYALDVKDEEAALRIMERLLSNVETLHAPSESPLYRHMQFNHFDTDWEKVRSTLKQSFLQNDKMCFMQGNPAWRKLME